MKIENVLKKILCFNLLGILFYGQIAYALTVNQYEKKIKNLYSVKRILDKSSQKELESILRNFIKKTFPSRFVGTNGHSQTVPYLIDVIKSYDPKNSGFLTVEEFKPDIEYGKNLYLNDFKTKIQSKFTPQQQLYKKWNRFTQGMLKLLKGFEHSSGKNLVWEKTGSQFPNEMIIIGAHYDSITFDKKTLLVDAAAPNPGANDNASAVSALLYLIKILAQIDLPRTVRIVFFDFEEIAFLGSRAYVKRHLEELTGKTKKKFIGYLNLEMIGHDTKIFDKQGKTGNMQLYIRKKTDKEHLLDKSLAKIFKSYGDQLEKRIKFQLVSNSWESSDHLAFWEHHLPAITFTQNWDNDHNEKGYHTTGDVVESINLKTLHRVFRYIAGSVVAWSFKL